jgi:hypothetical protein
VFWKSEELGFKVFLQRVIPDKNLPNSICGKHFEREATEVEKGLKGVIIYDTKQGFWCRGVSNGVEY